MRYLSALILLITLCGCSYKDSVHAQNDRNDPDAQRRRDLQSGLERRLKKLDREIEELESRAGSDTRIAKLKSRNEFYDRMAELEKQRTDTRQKYEELRRASKEKWEKLEADVESATQKFEETWHKFVDELGQA